MRLFLGIFSVSLALAANAQADIHLCDSVWTNRECSASQETRLSEKPYQPPDPAQQLADRKKFMLNELDLRRLKVTREQQLNFEIESARAACSASNTSLADCQKAVTEANDQLDKRIAAAAISRPEPEQQRSSTGNQTVVTVIDNSYTDLGRRRRHDYDYYDHGHGHHDSNSAGIGITAGINSPNANLGITAGVGSGAPRPNRGDRPGRESVTQPIAQQPATQPVRKSLSGEAKALR